MLGEGATGLTRDDLVARDLVTWKDKGSGAPNPLALTIPGDSIDKAALGYLHANCGVSCHNDNPLAAAQESGFFMRLDHTALSSPLTTPIWTTGFGRRPSPNAPLTMLPALADGKEYVDIAPLEPERSLIHVRMGRRNEDAAMPRLGTRQIDPAGLGLIEQWLKHMTPENGYPAATP